LTTLQIVGLPALLHLLLVLLALHLLVLLSLIMCAPRLHLPLPLDLHLPLLLLHCVVLRELHLHAVLGILPLLMPMLLCVPLIELHLGLFYCEGLRCVLVLPLCGVHDAFLLRLLLILAHPLLSRAQRCLTLGKRLVHLLL